MFGTVPSVGLEGMVLMSKERRLAVNLLPLV